jgi:hypothetical protein
VQESATRLDVPKEDPMVANVQVVHSADDAEMWRVAVNGQNLVGFYGRGARAQAERHREELMEILTGADWRYASVSPDHDEPRSPSVSRSDRNPLIV